MFALLTPCRLSFVFCVVVSFFVDADHASHVDLGEPPRPVFNLQPRGTTYG